MSTSGNPRGQHAQGNSTYRGIGGRGQGNGDGHGGDRRAGSHPGSDPGRGVGPVPSRSRFSAHSGNFRDDVPAQLPPLLEAEGLQQLVETFKDFKVTSPTRPLRPDHGTVGTEIKLRTNFFAVKLLQKQPIYSYVVNITPQPGFNRLKTHIFQLLEQNPAIAQHITCIAHDGRQTLISATKLPQPLNVIVPVYGGNQPARDYFISIMLAREFDPNELTSYMEGQHAYRDYNPLPFVSALNLVLRQHADRVGVQSGRNRYFFPTLFPKQDLGPGLDAVQGFYSTARPAPKQLLVNVNVCTTAFVRPGNLAGKLLEFRQSLTVMPTLPRGMVRGIRVRVLGHRRNLFAIGSTTARNTYFEYPGYGNISVEQYFLSEYNRKLIYPTELPVVNVSAGKSHWLPAELCDVEEGNIYRGRLDGREAATMVRYSRNKPHLNADYIVNRGTPAMGLKSLMDPVFGFGITIDNEMLVIPGRELNPPNVMYGKGEPRVQNGSWNILEVKFQHGAIVAGWWVVVVQDGFNLVEKPDDIRPLADRFQQKMRQSGMHVPGASSLLPPARLESPVKDPDRKKSLNIIRKLFAEELQKRGGVKPSFILVLLERRDKYIYSGIKRIGDIEMGIHTVHMQLEKANKGQDQYFSSVVLKANTKLGGINHLLEPEAMAWLNKNPTMMVGIDVAHPCAGSLRGTPSIAAVVASVDENFVQFPASLRIQRCIGMDQLKDMMVERLEVYQKKNNGRLPDRIFIYRNGVSEGLIDKVLDKEVPQILAAFNEFSNVEGRKEYRPTISIFIWSKHHLAKLWPVSSQFADQNGNTRPGTVVDKGITGVFDFDFYLQAHAATEGHVKATRYRVIYDENGLTANEVQQGTYDFSYLYARSTTAVSLIPVAYYAGLACKRGRCYLNDLLGDYMSTVDTEEGTVDDVGVYEAAKAHWGQGLHPDIRGSMFYI